MTMDFYTTKEAGRRLGLYFRTVSFYCRTMGIGKKVGRDYILTEEDIVKLSKRNTKPGPRPRGE